MYRGLGMYTHVKKGESYNKHVFTRIVYVCIGLLLLETRVLSH